MCACPRLLSCVAFPVFGRGGASFKPDNEELREAVDLWFSRPRAAEERYGPMSTWDTSRVTDMSKLFQYRDRFNEDISAWDVGAVENMCQMFYKCEAFQCDISGWDTSRVRTMESMFRSAKRFNAPIGAWNVGAVENMDKLFHKVRRAKSRVRAWRHPRLTARSLFPSFFFRTGACGFRFFFFFGTAPADSPPSRRRRRLRISLFFRAGRAFHFIFFRRRRL